MSMFRSGRFLDFGVLLSWVFNKPHCMDQPSWPHLLVSGSGGSLTPQCHPSPAVVIVPGLYLPLPIAKIIGWLLIPHPKVLASFRGEGILSQPLFLSVRSLQPSGGIGLIRLSQFATGCLALYQFWWHVSQNPGLASVAEHQGSPALFSRKADTIVEMLKTGNTWSAVPFARGSFLAGCHVGIS